MTLCSKYASTATSDNGFPVSASITWPFTPAPAPSEKRATRTTSGSSSSGEGDSDSIADEGPPPVRRSLPVRRSRPVRPRPVRRAPTTAPLIPPAPRAAGDPPPDTPACFDFCAGAALPEVVPAWGPIPRASASVTFDAVVPARFRGATVPARSLCADSVITGATAGAACRRVGHPSTGPPRQGGAAALALVSATPSTSLRSSSVATTRTRAIPTTPSPTRMETLARRPRSRRRSLGDGL